MTNINRFFKLAHIINNTRVRKNRIGTIKKNVNKNVLDIYHCFKLIYIIKIM